jgi:hypothetical protein
MEENKRLYPIDEEVFNRKVLAIIEKSYIRKGCPPKASRYKAFCGVLYIPGTGRPWRDLPSGYGYWRYTSGFHGEVNGDCGQREYLTVLFRRFKLLQGCQSAKEEYEKHGM